jgi:CBS domain-containing protein
MPTIIRDVMNPMPARIRAGSTMREAAEEVRRSQCSDLMVVDPSGNFVGVLSEGDLIRAVLPNLEELLGEASFDAAKELFESKGANLGGQSIDGIVITKPITVGPSDRLHAAASTMIRKQIRRLPVVEGGKLVGTVARADICFGVLA